MELGDVQAYLKRIELYQGEVDGKYSPSVKVAIEAFSSIRVSRDSTGGAKTDKSSPHSNC